MMTPIKFDRTISIGHILSVLIFLVGGLGAYYDLKGSVNIHSQQISVLQNTILEDRRMQLSADAEQDKQRNAAMLDLKGSLSDTKKDIKDDIRDLRNDIARGQAQRGTTR